MKAPACPVCGRRFKNTSGMKGHLFGMKDAAHLAERTRILSAAPPSPAYVPPVQPSPTLPVSAPGGSAPIQPSSMAPPRDVRPPNPSPTLTPDPPTKGPSEGQGEVKIFSLPPPGQVGPLLPDQGPFIPPTPPTDKPGGGLNVPLEPFIAGSVALMVNGFILHGEGDGKLRPEEVTESGFPKAAEACVKLYFPTLPLDHPLVALFVSGAGLASAIASKKAPKKKGPKEPGDVEEPETLPSLDPPKRQSNSTGDSYWDSILAQAGGLRGGVAGDD